VCVKLGGEEVLTKEGVGRYMLILSYCPNGTLQEYIKANTLDLPTFCKMGLSISAGLAHLHTEIRNGGEPIMKVLSETLSIKDREMRTSRCTFHN
jgi:hypothetical protein